METKRRIAIIGGGPSGLFLFKSLLESGQSDFEVEIFERKNNLGAGMPYSEEGANVEHVTNVSDSETPKLVTSIRHWLQYAPTELLERFDIDLEKFTEYKVLPRLLFGHYLTAQFNSLLQIASNMKIEAVVHDKCQVLDISYEPDEKAVWIITANDRIKFDDVIICTGHSWPIRLEDKYKGCFDSPYPPSKLNLTLNHPVAIKGASLTAIDAVRTLARHNGSFEKDANGTIKYFLNEESKDFKLTLHSRGGLLPAVRFHLEDSHLRGGAILTEQEIEKNKKENDGFLSLDFLFEKNFKENFREIDPEFYARIKDMSIEEFVDEMMELRLRVQPFQLLKAEYSEAEKSIKRQQSIYWKEMLAILSFAMNRPAKYFSAEDMQRLQKVLMPLISIVIAFVPQNSCDELLALYQADVLSIVAVGHDSAIEPQNEGGVIYTYVDDNEETVTTHYPTFIDCVGQPHLSFEDFPFSSLKSQNAICQARLKFRSVDLGDKASKDGRSSVEVDSQGNYYLNVPGISINDNFQIMDQYGVYNENIYVMAVPYIGGFNPDYSGLDFCEASSSRIVKNMFSERLLMNKSSI